MFATEVKPASVTELALEPAARLFAEKIVSAPGPPLYEMTPPDARSVLERLQSEPVAMAEAEVEEHTIPGGSVGDVSIAVVKPVDSNGSLPPVVYSHGGGWALGNFGTHERLVRDLAAQTGFAFVFVNYTPSPEAQFPVAIEQIYATARWVAKRGTELGLDGRRLALAGDSVGGNMTAAVALLAKMRGGPAIQFQALLYPVTDANFETASYERFADGPWLTRDAMKWFWDAYLPGVESREQPIASPIQATLDQMRGLPPALIVTDEADVLRDEGEAYGRKLRQSGVDVATVRFSGVFHDFMMLDALAGTHAARAATSLTVHSLKVALSR